MSKTSEARARAYTKEVARETLLQVMESLADTITKEGDDYWMEDGTQIHAHTAKYDWEARKLVVSVGLSINGKATNMDVHITVKASAMVTE